MLKAKFLSTILIIVSVTSVCSAANIYVDVSGPNDPGTGTFDDPFRKIQNAIDAATAVDIVEIRPGIYTADPNNYNLDPNGKSITIRSTDPNNPNIVASTIINPNGAGRGFYIHNGEDSNCVISGLTIKNAYTTEIGAGIFCEQSSPTITNCSLINNHAEVYGGAVFCLGSNSLFVNCSVSRNSAYDGGGLSMRSGYPHLINCIISNNHAYRYGGGVDCYYQGDPNLTNCSLINNKTDIDGGGAICLWGSNANIKNSILWANEATSGAQLYLHFESSTTVSYCDVQGGISEVYYDSESTVNWGSGNIDTDPCFALFDFNSDPNLWDFHLQSIYGRWNTIFYRIDLNNDEVIDLFDFAEFASVWLQGGNLPEDLDRSGMVDWADLELLSQYYLANRFKDGWLTDATTSPCVDAGDPNSDWNNEPWPNGKRINMGAHGGTNQASKNGNLADFDVDGTVNYFDLMEFCSRWLDEDGGIVNLDLTGLVDFDDFAIFAENWLWQRE